MRGVVGRIGGLLAGRPRQRPALLDGVRSVLVIRVDERVGNVLLTTPIIERLQAELPWARIDVLVAASKQAIVDGVAGVIPFHKKDAFRRPWRLIRALWMIRRRRYDVAIDASHWHTFSTTSALLLAWTGAPIRIAHGRGEARRYATDPVPLPEDVEPEVRTKLRLLEPLQISPENASLATHLGESGPAAASMRAWITEAGLDATSVVGLVPGSRKVGHRAATEVFVEAGRAAANAGSGVLVLWGPGEDELASEVANRCGGTLAPPSSLDELAALIRACRVVVTNDTGPMHLSVACGVPTISVFVRGEDRRWGHRGGAHQVVVARDRPTPEVVAEVVEAVLTRLAE